MMSYPKNSNNGRPFPALDQSQAQKSAPCPQPITLTTHVTKREILQIRNIFQSGTVNFKYRAAIN